MYDLLSDPLLPVTVSGGETWTVTLPDLFALAIEDRIEAFPGLAAHQAQAWYQCLAQLGALVLLRGDWQGPPPGSAGEWCDLTAALTPGCADTAWSLVVEDAAKPAFMQPPTAKLADYKPLAETADGLDILVTAKNHDRKQGTASGNAPHLWLYALVTLQTQQGYSGRGGFGIARMNGGLSSRVLVDRRQGHRWGPRVARAIRMLCAQRANVLSDRGGEDIFANDNNGLALAWLKAWDADKPLRTQDLDPYFIEICRRVRLTADAEGLMVALGRPSDKARVDAAALTGNLADPWVPVEKGGKALTVSANGFDYRLAHRILLGSEFVKPLALTELRGERNQDSEIHMAVLVRGQGKTEGLHERIIKLPKSIAAALTPAGSDPEDGKAKALKDVSEHMVQYASNARRVLRQAMIVYLQGPEHPDFQSNCADPISQRYDRALDERFFDFLFEQNRDGFDAARTERAWQRFLLEEALCLAGEVWDGASAPSVRREKARAASESVLIGGLRKHIPLAFERTEDAA